MSTRNIYDAVIRAAGGTLKDNACFLDVGAGRGELIERCMAAANINSFACDFHVERFAVKGLFCAKVNFNTEPLPFQDCQFDLITSSEVIEHLENFRALLREMYRVAKKNSVLVVTTPNVLNTFSRFRYLISGFSNLFGPLPVRNDKLYSTGGHITPIPYFYLAHALIDAGFDEVTLSIDKIQKTSLFYLVLFFPVISIGWLYFMRRERKRFKTITAENEELVAAHFSWRLLVGRTIVVAATKR